MSLQQQLALVIQSAPYSQRSSVHAFNLAQTIITSAQATLGGIFFYGDGVYHALLPHAADNEPLLYAWTKLKVPLAICIASSQRRGIVLTPDQGFKEVGLGYLAALYSTHDKVIVFGS